MKTSLLSIIAALGLFTTISAQAASTAALAAAPIRIEAAHDDPRHMSRAERARYEEAQRRQKIEQQRRLAAERARLERERKLAAERARLEQRRHDDRRPADRRTDNGRSDYGYVRH